MQASKITQRMKEDEVTFNGLEVKPHAESLLVPSLKPHGSWLAVAGDVIVSDTGQRHVFTRNTHIMFLADLTSGFFTIGYPPPVYCEEG